MSYLTPNNSNNIDRNANSANRVRRNWQRARQGALTNTIRTSAPLTSSSTIGLAFFTSTGLGLVSNSLALLFADQSITGSVNGIAVAEQAGGGISTGAGGIAVNNTVVRTTRLINTTAPLAGGGDLSADRTLSIPLATSTANGYLSSTDWTTFNSKQASGNYLAGSTALGTTAPLAGGGNLSTGLTLSMPQATSTANGWLSSTDWTTFNNKGSGTLAAADTSIVFPTSSTFEVRPYKGLSTATGGVQIYGDQGTGFGPQVAISMTISTATNGSRCGMAVCLGSTTSTQANNAIIGDFNLRSAGNGGYVKLFQGSTLIASTTAVNFTGGLHSLSMVVSGTQVELIVDAVIYISNVMTVNDDTGVGWFIDSNTEIDTVKSWGASTGLLVFQSDTFPGAHGNNSKITANANYLTFNKTGNTSAFLTFNSSTTVDDTIIPSTAGLQLNATNITQAIVWNPSVNTAATPNKYQWGVAIAPSTGLLNTSTGLSVFMVASGGLRANNTGGLFVNSFSFASSDPSPPSQGQSWFNSATGVNKVCLAASGGTSLVQQLSGVYWNAVNGASVSSTTVKTNMAPGAPIPAGFFNVLGRTSRILLITGGNLASGSTTVTLNYGSTPIWTQTIAVNPASMWWEFIVETVVTGASGAFQTLARFSSFNTAMTFNTSTSGAVDLTSAQTLQFAVQFTAASSTNSMNQAYVTGELLV